MTISAEYTTSAQKARGAFTDAAETWTQNLQKAADQLGTPFVPTFQIDDPTAVISQWFDFTERVAKVNREYVLNLAGVVNALGGAVREHVEGLGEVMRDQTQVVTNEAKEQVDKAAQAERDLARAARAAERQRARQVRQSARERYEGMTKAELSEELGNRGLPKTGNVDDLVERLVDADTA